MLYPSELPGYPVAVAARIYTVEYRSGYGRTRPAFATHSRASANQVLAALGRLGSDVVSKVGPDPGIGNFWPRWATTPVRALVGGKSLLWGWAADAGIARAIGGALSNLGLQFEGRRITSLNFR